MLPKGLFGLCSLRQLQVEGILQYVRSHLSDEEDFICKVSSDKKCLVGSIISTLIPYPTSVSSCELNQSIGVIDGVFFSSSRLNKTPHRLLDPDVSLPSEANGMFNCAAYDGLYLSILSDPWGSMPLYYRQYQDDFIFSSSLNLILEFPEISKPKISREGLYQFLCWHTVLNGETVFDNIKKLRSAELLHYDIEKKRITYKKYWQPTVEPDYSQNTLTKSVAAFVQAIERTVAVAPQSISAAITGGFDSRTIWSVLKKYKGEVSAVTHASASGYDFQIALEIGKKLQLEHKIHWIGKDFLECFSDHLHTMIDMTNGFFSAENVHVPFVYRKHLDTTHSLLDGNHSSIEGRWALRNTSRHVKNRDDFFEAFWKQIFRPGLVSLLSNDEYQKEINVSREILFDIIPDPKEWASPGCAADVFNVVHLLGNHAVDAACLQNHFNRYLSPYLDLDYVNQVSKVPEKLRWKQVPQYAVVKKHAPELLSIPRSYSDIKTFSTINPYLMRLPIAWHRIAISKLRKIFPKKIVSALDPYRPSMIYDRWFRNELRHEVLKLKEIDLWFDKKKLAHFVDVYLEGKSSDTSSIAMLMTIGASNSIFRK